MTHSATDPLTVVAPAAPSLDADTLARAVLTYCGDGPDAMLYAALKGSESCCHLLSMICGPTMANAISWLDDPTVDGDGMDDDETLVQALVTGLARWGRSMNANILSNFRTALANWRSRLERLALSDADTLTNHMTQSGQQWLIGPSSPYWPNQLNDLAIRSDWAPPLCLWGIGNAASLTSCGAPVAVVGSREVNDYGRFIARAVGLQAAQHGHLVVSGGAMGADAAAHWGAVAARSNDHASDITTSGTAVAVFAGGLDHRGPSCNLRLFDAIMDTGGALISEMPPGTVPEARRFLLRNRIIAALADVVVIAQARHRSGALNTATWAAEMNRAILAAPGNINEPFNTGCNRLISEGKASILNSLDALADFAHAPHAPFFPSDTASYTDDGSSNTDREAPDDRQGDGTPIVSEQEVLSAIRSCQRRNDTSPDALARYLRRKHPDRRCTPAGLAGILGRLESQARIIREQGTIRITSTKRTAPPQEQTHVPHALFS